VKFEKKIRGFQFPDLCVNIQAIVLLSNRCWRVLALDYMFLWILFSYHPISSLRHMTTCVPYRHSTYILSTLSA